MNLLKGFIKEFFLIVGSVFNILRNYKPANLNKLLDDVDTTNLCYVLGNGPSLLKDIDKVSSSNSIIGVNSFVHSDYFVKLKPKYYVLADPIFWSNKKYRDGLVEMRKGVYEQLKLKTTWPLYIIAPSLSKNSNLLTDAFQDNKNIKIRTYNPIEITGPDWFKFFCYEKLIGTPPTQNVLVAATYVAVFLNFKEIRVLGADHSWHEDIFINDENQVCLVDKHFYDSKDKKLVGKPWLKGNGDSFKMSELFPTLGRMFKGYDELEKYAKRKTLKIINESSKTYIDAFEKLN